MKISVKQKDKRETKMKNPHHNAGTHKTNNNVCFKN